MKERCELPRYACHFCHGHHHQCHGLDNKCGTHGISCDGDVTDFVQQQDVSQSEYFDLEYDDGRAMVIDDPTRMADAVYDDSIRDHLISEPMTVYGVSTGSGDEKEDDTQQFEKVVEQEAEKEMTVNVHGSSSLSNWDGSEGLIEDENANNVQPSYWDSADGSDGDGRLNDGDSRNNPPPSLGRDGQEGFGKEDSAESAMRVSRSEEDEIMKKATLPDKDTELPEEDDDLELQLFKNVAELFGLGDSNIVHDLELELMDLNRKANSRLKEVSVKGASACRSESDDDDIVLKHET